MSASIHPGRFEGKIVAVTGAAQGIGRSVALRIAAEGGTIALIDRSALVHEVVEKIHGDGGRAQGLTADLECFESAEEAFESLHEHHGRIDVLVNNVGGTIWAKPFEKYTADQIRTEIQRSLFPTLWCCRAVLPHMIDAGGGTVVNVSSVATRGVNRIPYSAAKGGTNALTSALALEAAPHNVRVVATAPGGTEAPERRVPRGPGAGSEQERVWSQEVVDQTTEHSLMRRYGSLEEQAAAICFLASPEASYINGSVLPVAGGDLG